MRNKHVVFYVLYLEYNLAAFRTDVRCPQQNQQNLIRWQHKSKAQNKCESLTLLRPQRASTMTSIYMPIPIPNSFHCVRAGFEFRQISVRFTQHPNWE